MNKISRILYIKPPSCILVVNTAGKLLLLCTPFYVKCITSIHPFGIGDIVYVSKVAIDHSSRHMQYLINGGWYGYYHFTLIVKF
jgi:hypothetical protein